jgi:hypothetical protein
MRGRIPGLLTTHLTPLVTQLPVAILTLIPLSAGRIFVPR